MADTGENKNGQRFGRYLLLERIGSGGMAEVYRAVAHGMEGFQRTFVLKRIRADHTTQPDFLDMFVNEARISALLDHENIVQVYDFGEVEGCYFLTMEYLRGKDLSTVLRKLYGRQAVAGSGHRRLRRLQGGARVGLRAQPAVGWRAAVDHPPRCLTLEHHVVAPGGVKLLDFGIAKTQPKYNVGETTETGVCKGKLPYLSPEHVDGQILDRRSDIFGLGVVLWEALTGRRLFLGRTDFETMQNVLSRPIPPPSLLRPEIPAALDRIVVRALARDREQRYGDARVLADELESVMQDLRYRSDAIPDLADRSVRARGEQRADHAAAPAGGGHQCAGHAGLAFDPPGSAGRVSPLVAWTARGQVALAQSPPGRRDRRRRAAGCRCVQPGQRVAKAEPQRAGDR